MSFMPMEGHQFILVSVNHGNELDFANKLLLGDLGFTSYSKYITYNKHSFPRYTKQYNYLKVNMELRAAQFAALSRDPADP